MRDVVHDGAKMTGTACRRPAYPVAPGTDAPVEEFVIIERMPVKSLVTFPRNGAEVGRSTEVRGHAWSGDRQRGRYAALRHRLEPEGLPQQHHAPRRASRGLT